jgi:23S rRNA (uridine2552-2'-O)-methyltransferase
VGVDLVACPKVAPNVVTMVADIREPATVKTVAESLGGLADLVTSDLAPKLSGVADRDQARMLELVEAALGCARELLKPGGAMIAKLFMGGDFAAAANVFEREFSQVELTRPRASRPGSSELYLIARDFRRSARKRTGVD